MTDKIEAKDRACNLQCVKDCTVHEFVGPVKIILIDPPKNEYKLNKILAAFIAVSNMMIGATVMVVLIYSLKFELSLYKNLHVVLCTIGYQLCMPSAILMLNALNGAAAPLKLRDRKYQHAFLHIFGMSCGLTGAALKYFHDAPNESKTTFHSYAGCVSGCLAMCNFIIGPCLLKKTLPPFISMFHNVLGVLSLLASSVCFIFYVPSFLGTSKEKEICLKIFCVFYTFVIIFTPLSKFLRRKQK